MTRAKARSQLFLLIMAFFGVALSARARGVRAELHIAVYDPQGAALAATGELMSEANQFRRAFQVGADGHYVAQQLPFGIYKLSLSAAGFAPRTDLIEIQS